jgi:hypothetical protein
VILRFCLQLDETGKRKINALHRISPAMQEDILALASVQGMPAVESIVERAFQASVEKMLSELEPWKW